MARNIVIFMREAAKAAVKTETDSKWANIPASSEELARSKKIYYEQQREQASD